MKQPVHLNRPIKPFLCLFSLFLTFLNTSSLPCASYAVTCTMDYLDYDPLNPSSTTFFCSITLSNSQSIGAASELIDSFAFIFDNHETSSPLQLDNNALTIGIIASVAEPIDLSVKRVLSDKWEIYIGVVYVQSSGIYTCSIAGCHSTNKITVEYIPRIFQPTFLLTIPANSLKLKIKCPIEKTLYYLYICNVNNSNCVNNIPRVSYSTPNEELYFAPPLINGGLVEQTQQIILCQILPVSGYFFRKSEIKISVLEEKLYYQNLTTEVGTSIDLTLFCQEFADIFTEYSTIIFSNVNNNTLLPQIQINSIDYNGYYYCTIQHEYFRVSMLILNLSVIPIEIETTPPMYTSISQETTTTTTTTTQSLTIKPVTYIDLFEYPNYIYYLAFPGGLFTIIVLFLSLCCCCFCVSCICYRKYCSGRSRKFSAREISSPIPEGFALQPHEYPEPYNYHQLRHNTPFNGGFEESVFNEIPILRPHKNQTLRTQPHTGDQLARQRAMYRQRSHSLPDIDITPVSNSRATPKHSSVGPTFDISSTQPPSQSVSIDNIILEHSHRSAHLAPPPIHTRQRSQSAEEVVQYSYGILPSPTFHPITYVPVPAIPSPYIATHSIAFVQPANLTPVLSPPHSIVPNVPPPSPIVFHTQQLPIQQIIPLMTSPTQPRPPAIYPVTSHQYLPSISNTEQHINTPTMPTPETQMTPTNTTININIINRESLANLPPDHYVDFL